MDRGVYRCSHFVQYVSFLLFGWTFNQRPGIVRPDGGCLVLIQVEEECVVVQMKCMRDLYIRVEEVVFFSLSVVSDGYSLKTNDFEHGKNDNSVMREHL